MSSGPSPSSTPMPTSTTTWRHSMTSPLRWRRHSKSGSNQQQSPIKKCVGGRPRPPCTHHQNSGRDSRRGCPPKRSEAIVRKKLSTTTQSAEQPHLIRALGRRDLVLLFVVAVFNLNVVPSIAANGGVTVWLWIISLLLFFWPQGIAVIELAHRYPGEGGVYLWAKEVFGDFHGFLSGWCYWTNNMMYVPTVMLYFVGVSVYVLGPGHA